MSSDAILLIGREARNAREVLAAHADGLDGRGVADAVEVATYEHDPVRELPDRFERLAPDTVYAVPMCTAHTHETIADVPAALSYVAGDVHYCEPPGGSPAVTEVIAEHAARRIPASDDASLVLVASGAVRGPTIDGRRTITPPDSGNGPTTGRC